MNGKFHLTLLSLLTLSGPTTDLDTHEEGDGHGDQEEDEGEAGEDECADSRVLVVYAKRRLTRESDSSLQTKPNIGCWRYRIYKWN